MGQICTHLYGYVLVHCIPILPIAHELLQPFYQLECAAMAQSVQRLATGWTARGSKAGRGEIFHTRPDRP